MAMFADAMSNVNRYMRNINTKWVHFPNSSSEVHSEAMEEVYMLQLCQLQDNSQVKFIPLQHQTRLTKRSVADSQDLSNSALTDFRERRSYSC